MRKVIATEWMTLDIAPLVLGSGKRLFRGNGPCRALQLIDHRVTTTGAVLVTYARRD